VSEAHIHRDTQRANNKAGRQKNKADCHRYFLTDPQHGEKGGNAGDGRKAGPVLGCDWPATPALWVMRSEIGGRRSEVRFPNFPISDFSFCLREPTLVGRFHGQAVLQRRVLA
jgi:hypothetical protein